MMSMFQIEKGNLERYNNIYRIEMLVRHASDGKLYLCILKVW